MPLALRCSLGIVSITFVASRKFCMLAVNNKDGRGAIGLSVSQGGGYLAVNDNAIRTVAELGAKQSGGSLSISSSDGVIAASVSVLDSLTGGLVSVRNKEQTQVALMAANIDGGGVMMTADRKGKATVIIPEP